MQMDVSTVNTRVAEPFRWKISAPESVTGRGRRGAYRLGGRGVSPVLAARWEAIEALESTFRALARCLVTITRPHAASKQSSYGMDGQDRAALLALLATNEPPARGRGDVDHPGLN